MLFKDRFLVITVTLLISLLLGYNYAIKYLEAGLPAGIDASGHFVLTQLYYDSHWPALNGRINNFFQGMSFPLYYPPLFYWISGLFYWLLPELEREMAFKILTIFPIFLLPTLLVIFSTTIKFSKNMAILVGLISAIFLFTGDNFTRTMPSLIAATETGLVSQAWGVVAFVLLLIFSLASMKAPLQFILVAIGSAIFFVSNYHVIVTGVILLGLFFLQMRYLQGFKLLPLIISMLCGLSSVAIWYLNIFLDDLSSPAIPIGNLNFDISAFVILLLFAIPVALIIIMDQGSFEPANLFCYSCFLTLPIIILPLDALGINIAWQPHRMYLLINFFVPIALVQSYVVIQRFIAHFSPKLIFRLKLAGSLMLATIFIVYTIPEVSFSKLPSDQEASIKKLNLWLKNNPIVGYSVVPFTDTSSTITEIALSHYPALAGESMIWSIFRESSFNSVFATALRNSISTQNETYGIPVTPLIEEYREMPLSKRIEILPELGISRIITLSHSSNNFITSSNKLRIAYSNNHFMVLDYIIEPVLHFTSNQAQVFIGPTISTTIHQNTALDFIQVGHYLLNNPMRSPVILLFTSCASALQALPKTSFNAICSSVIQDTCCKKYITNASELFENPVLSNINLKISNTSWDRNASLLAAPWRNAVLVNFATE